LLQWEQSTRNYQMSDEKEELFAKIIPHIRGYLNTSPAEKSAFNEKRFKTWFMDRMDKCGACFDWRTLYRLYWIYTQDLKKDNDHFLLIVGKEGSGKSTLASQLTGWINPLMDMEKVFIYTAKQFIDRISEIMENPEVAKGEPPVLIIDEASLDLFSRDSMRKSSRNLNKLFFQMRQLNCFVVVIIQDLWSVDALVREHRCNTLIQTFVPRGDTKVMFGKAISLVSTYGKKERRISSVKLPMELFYFGKFRKSFPKCYDYEKYQKMKGNSLRDFLKDIRKTSDFEKEYVPTSKIAQAMGISTETATNRVKKGVWEGKKDGGYWYVKKSFANQLLERE